MALITKVTQDGVPIAVNYEIMSDFSLEVIVQEEVY